jgi:AraC-like DNA-binding protein
VFNIGDQVYLSDSGTIFFDQARSFVAGPFDRFQRHRAEGQFELIGARFHLGRAPFFARLPLGELRNRAVSLDEVWEEQALRAEIQDLELRLTQVSRMVERIDCVERFLMKFLRYWEEPDPVVIRAIDFIAESRGQISVEALTSEVRISGRQLERKFNQHVGLSPKAFCRVTRFRQVMSMIESIHRPSGGPSGCDLAYACGYYDQTHLIREFRWFTGQTPASYQRVQPVGFFLYDCLPNCYSIQERSIPNNESLMIQKA